MKAVSTQNVTFHTVIKYFLYVIKAYGTRVVSSGITFIQSFVHISLLIQNFIYHMSLMDFVVSPPGCGWSVTDLRGWDAHEAQLRCPNEVDGDIWIWSTRRGLKPKFYWTTQTMVNMGVFPFKEKSPWQNRELKPGPLDK
jgi:hypothetical protein